MDASEKAYMGIAETFAAYPAQYASMSGDRLKLARAQHDEATSAVDDEDEIPETLKAAIRTLRATYDARVQKILADAKTADSALGGTRSPLAKAEAAVTKAQVDLDTAIAFPDQASTWFDDVEALSTAVKESAAAGNMRMAYAQFLELDYVYHHKILDHFGDAATKGSEDWLRGTLTAGVMTLIGAQYARFTAASQAETAEATAAAANDLVKSFITDNGRRVAFLREAQDVVLPVTPATPPVTGQTDQTAATQGAEPVSA